MREHSIFEPTYRLKEIERFTGLTAVQLRYLDKKSIVKPSIQQGGSKGAIRVYSVQEMMDLITIGGWKHLGYSTQKILQTCLFWKGATIQPWEGVTLVGLKKYCMPDTKHLSLYKRELLVSYQHEMYRTSIEKPELAIEARREFEESLKESKLNDREGRLGIFREGIRLAEHSVKEMNPGLEFVYRSFDSYLLDYAATFEGEIKTFLKEIEVAVEKEDKDRVFLIAKEITSKFCGEGEGND